VLIGENQWGRTSLTRALEAALGDSEQRVTDDDRTSGVHGPIEICLDIGESQPGEFDGCAPLAALPCSIFGHRVVRLRLIHQDGATTPAILNAEGDPLPVDRSTAQAAHEALRQQIPVIRLSLWDAAGRTGDPTVANAAWTSAVSAWMAPDREGPPSRQMLLRSAEAATHDLAARRLLDAASLDLVAELRALPSAWRHAERQFANADRVCAMLIAAHALLKADRRGAGDGVRPILLVEDPETHLHPTLLSNLWSLVERLPAQRLVTTNSPDFLGAIDLRAIRRLVRRPDRTVAHGVKSRDLSESDVRRLSYHIRTLRGGAFFARAWILVEGETEFWSLPGVASLLGHDLDAEGIRLVEFAQAGLESVLRLASSLAMPVHALVDGDAAGRGYADIIHRHDAMAPCRLTVLPANSIERYFWDHGLDGAILESAYGADAGDVRSPGRAIEDAIRRHTKPGLARRLLDEMVADPERLVPKELGDVVASAIGLARQSVRN
jgi:putative ATP-dependent endonuclease of OLD family